MTKVFDLIRMIFPGNRYFYLFLACAAAGLALGRGARKRFFVPGLLLTVALLNPVTMKLWDKLDDGSNVFWRLVWMVPVVAFCASIPALLVERAGKKPLKWLSVLAGVAVFALLGSQVYDYPLTAFSRANGPDKLPEAVVKVADALLELDDAPRVMSDAGLSVYLRQYSGRIKAPYSRDVVHIGPSNALAERLYGFLQDEKWDDIARELLNNDYQYLATANADRAASIEAAGFELVRQVDGYGIYRVTGSPTEVRRYNALHQVVSVTTVDGDGHPQNDENGRATVEYDYDRYGRVVYEFYTDADGRGVADGAGKAGYRCERDRQGRVLSKTWLDAAGEPVERGDAKYATLRRSYDRRGNLVREAYFDTSDAPTACSDGYAAVEWRYERERLLSVRYLDADGAPVDTLSGGYSEYVNRYADGALSLTDYYDAAGNRVRCGSGWLHEYLQGLRGKTFVVAACDDASKALTATLVEDMAALGIKTDLRGRFQNGFYAVVTPDGVIEDAGEQRLEYAGEIEGMRLEIVSAGFTAGNTASIRIDGAEYSKNVRGLNFVVLEGGAVAESVAFDTWSPVMRMTE